MQATASLMKVEFVLEVARKDPRFLKDLDNDPVKTLQESGIDLSAGEVIATLDVVKNTSYSPLAPLLAPHRARWQSVRLENEREARPKA
jgi:hypothetical protein